MSSIFTAKALRSVPWMLSAKAVSFVVYFFVSIMIVKALSPEDYGVLALSKNFGQYLIIFCALGLNTCILRYLPEIELEKNYSSIKAFLCRSLFCQFTSWLICISFIYLIKAQVFQYLSTSSDYLLFLVFVWILAWVVKNTVTDSLTALFEAKTVAMIAVLQSALVFMAILWVCSQEEIHIEYILFAEFAALGITTLCGLFRLRKCLQKPSIKNGISIAGRRVIKLASPVWFNGLLRSLMLQYTEVFVLAYCFMPAVAGFYELGYSLPLLAITFIPMALQTLFSSAFAEAYQRDKKLLPKMVNSMFKVLILLSAPLAATGFLFSEALVGKLYGEDMQQAGSVAKYFSLIHVLPLISMPLSMAVTTLEKNSRTVGLLILQVIVNISLDIILIPTYGLNGAVAAVFMTFVLTIPIRLSVIRRLIGGIWFPFKFFLKIILTVSFLSFMCSLLPSRTSLWAEFALATLFIASNFVILWRLNLLDPLLEIINKKSSK
ncbi:oligosaccharide flippase family protein [Lentisphaera marina]|uniref:oligosaccharide flippase family protein n=1 Tax=Lentisphaera marina TaxID=1111041 RepID=UPI0023658ADA|nr:oligosaccharide flippase family protein [Lentisphaera marina]MDD7987221.1 oligosaccharide flippase family protein [Lentisphaera marina]